MVVIIQMGQGMSLQFAQITISLGGVKEKHATGRQGRKGGGDGAHETPLVVAVIVVAVARSALIVTCATRARFGTLSLAGSAQRRGQVAKTKSRHRCSFGHELVQVETGLSFFATRGIVTPIGHVNVVVIVIVITVQEMQLGRHGGG